jgi:hypothetical protein
MTTLTDLTPADFVCASCSQCPTVYKTDRGTYILVGKKLNADVRGQVAHKIGADEDSVEIPAGLLANVLK